MKRRLEVDVTRQIVGFAAVVLLVGCAATRTIENSFVERVEFLGAHDALAQNGRRLPSSIFSQTIEGGQGVHSEVLPLSYAIECDAAITDCRHAGVRTEIKLHAQRIGGQAVQVNGTMSSAMGRSQSIVFDNGLSFMSTKMTVPDSVAIIAERTQPIPIDLTVRIGEFFDLEGLAGVIVRVSYHEPAVPYGGLRGSAQRPTLGMPPTTQ